MSLALWSFFWTDTDWLNNPAPPPPAVMIPGVTNAGGGKSRDVHIPPDFWDAREAYLRSVYETPPQPDIAADNTAAIAEWEARKAQIEQLTAQRSEAIIALRRADDLKTMRAQGTHIAELTDKISKLTHKQAFQNFMKH